MNRSDLLGALAVLPIAFGNAERAGAQQQGSGTVAAGRPQDVVARQVAAFNAHDAATVTKYHAPTAAITVVPSGKVLADGSDQIATFFSKAFEQSPKIVLSIDKQYVFKNVVINHYAVSDGPGPELVSVYEVVDGVIASEWLVFG